MGVNITRSGVVTQNGVVVTPNIFVNSDFHSRVENFDTWNVEKNGTVYANYWGGYNSGVSNAATAYHAHLTNMNGEWVYEYIRDTEGWLGISQGGLQSKLTAGATYIFTCEQYCPTGSKNFLHGGFYYALTTSGNTGNGFRSGTFSGSMQSDTKDKWVKIQHLFTISADANLSGNVSFYIYGYGNGTSGNTGTVYMRHPKVELGTTATPWTLAESEGVTAASHSFIEILHNKSFYNNYAEINNFIEK